MPKWILEFLASPQPPVARDFGPSSTWLRGPDFPRARNLWNPGYVEVLSFLWAANEWSWNPFGQPIYFENYKAFMTDQEGADSEQNIWANCWVQTHYNNAQTLANEAFLMLSVVDLDERLRRFAIEQSIFWKKKQDPCTQQERGRGVSPTQRNPDPLRHKRCKLCNPV